MARIRQSSAEDLSEMVSQLEKSDDNHNKFKEISSVKWGSNSVSITY